MFSYRTVAVMLGSALAAACATTHSPYHLESADQDKLSRQLVGQAYTLASSVYVTDFFGERDKFFIEARPFDIVELYHHDGTRVPTGMPLPDVIPAGTPVKITAVQYPVNPLLAQVDTPVSGLLPTAHPWLVLERTDGGAKVPLVMVLPREIDDALAFNAEVALRLKSEQWVTQWLTARPPLVLAGIARKEPQVDMTYADLVATLGTPKNTAQKTDDALTEFVADYGDWQITIVSNTVKAIVSRKADAASSQARAQAQAEIARQKAQAAVQADEQAEAHEAMLLRVEAAKSSRDLSITVTDVDPQVGMALGLKNGGAFVTAVEPTGEGKKAGLDINDIIIAVNGLPVIGQSTFQALMRSAKPRQRLEIDVVHRGTTITLVTGTEEGPALSLRNAPEVRAPIALDGTTQAPTAPTPVVKADTTSPVEPARLNQSEELPWWRDDHHVGVSLKYVFGKTHMRDAKQLSKDLFTIYKANQADDATLFGFAHGAELMVVYNSPWVARAQIGVEGLLDKGSLTLRFADATNTANVDGYAWAVAIPVLVGARVPFLDRKLAATLDVGPEILVDAGLSYDSAELDSPDLMPEKPNVGVLVRAGLAYHFDPRFAVTLEGSWRQFETFPLVSRDDPKATVLAPNGKPLEATLDFSGVGGTLGLVGYFL